MQKNRIKKICCWVTLWAVSLLMLSSTAIGETVRGHAIAIKTKTLGSAEAPVLHFSFEPDTNSIEFSVKKKLIGDTVWSNAKWLGPLDLEYSDSSVSKGEAYEYNFKRTSYIYVNDTLSVYNDAWAYLYAGVEYKPTEHRGRLLVFIDSSMKYVLEYELERFEQDIAGDGWQVARYYVPRTEKFNSGEVKRIKDIILDNYKSYGDTLKSVILFGRVAVPYSGGINIDAHPDHKGAWPADIYYSDLTGIYTDTSMVDTSAKRSENHNFPGDGKFDNAMIAGKADLQLGRIDFYNLPSFPQNEMTLLKNYLDKNHAFRISSIKPKMQAVIDNNFGLEYHEAFAANGWLSLLALLNPDSVSEGKFMQKLTNDTCIWSYACGPGVYYSAGGVGSSDDFAAVQMNGIFSIIFGSYMGDWDSENNLLRAAIASTPSMLTCCWGGRPFWFFHTMAMGLPIGYSTLISQNNQDSYESTATYGFRYMNIDLMGDPTLKMRYPEQPSNLQSVVNVNENNSNHVDLSWDEPTGGALGYNIYRSESFNGYFEKLNDQLINNTEFVDFMPMPGRNIYMLRALNLLKSETGTYFDQSTGIFSDAYLPYFLYSPFLPLYMSITPNYANDFVNIGVSMAQEGYFRLEAYDISGKKIKEIANVKYSPPKRHLFSWNLRDEQNAKLATGVYYIRLSTFREIITSKVFVIP